MAFWGKKQQKKPETIITKEPECHHKYRDFPWYIECIIYNNHTFEIKVIEPYVCVWCGHRENKVLQEVFRTGNAKDARQTVADMKETYGDNIQPRALVENDINDMQLVDRDYLRALAFVKPSALAGMDDQAQVALRKS